jgi:methyl-accepting chemotaxis protein
LNIAAKVIAPFTVIFVCSTVILAVMSYSILYERLSGSMAEKAKSTAVNMAAVLGAPVNMGEFDRIQLVIDAEKKADPDLVYAAVVSPDDGKIIVATDGDMKDTQNPADPYEKQALKATGFTERAGKHANSFEVIMPIKSDDQIGAFLRLCFSTQRVGVTVTQCMLQIALIGMIALAVGMIVYIVAIRKFIVGPIQNVAEKASLIAVGELVQVERVEQDNEIGALQDSMNALIQYLIEMSGVADAIASGDVSVRVEPRSENDIFGHAFKKMVESLSSIIQELVQSAQGLSAVAAEMSASSSQQSQMMAEQATSIQESLGTLEEIRIIVNQASDKAQSVVEISDRSLDVSKKGQEALEQSLLAMVKIRDQVQAIARNIVELSQKTVQIGEITSSVEEIAEQSNLLTVNAAIEAIRAGDQGRGFGVVATEVKNLAQQSKRATRQVRTILGEIRQATSSTVVVTEEGSKRVESGVQQVNEIGTNFSRLNGVIVESSNAAKQIASATYQQVAGIEQIAMGMRSISQAANDTAASAKLQSNTAANLSVLVASIHSIVKRYKLQ